MISLHPCHSYFNPFAGLENFCDDLEFMSNKKVSLYWRLCWSFFTPVMMIVIFIYSMATIKPIKYSELYFPVAGDGKPIARCGIARCLANISMLYIVAGWLLFVVGAAQFPLWGWWYISTHRRGSFAKVSSELYIKRAPRL